MKLLALILFTILFFKTSFAQIGKYYGSTYTCHYDYNTEEFFWIELKKDSTFEYNIIIVGVTNKCLNLEGKWRIKNDTLILSNPYSNFRKLHYRISENSIENLNKDRIVEVIYNYGSDDPDAFLTINKGVDDFTSEWILSFYKIDYILANPKLGFSKSEVLRWSNKRCCSFLDD